MNSGGLRFNPDAPQIQRALASLDPGAAARPTEPNPRLADSPGAGAQPFIVSHRMDDIFTTADRIVVLRRGRKIEDVRKENTSMDDIIKKIIHAEKESLSQETLSPQTA